ncbi:WXG100 family type VII secretion target [Micromonospora sp. NPDC047620]|uniref:WXG100 family type VII secretion target n=1 Tax=Micromonospora sp. NPDC047620 TaxID=3364251 RepID=UPI0037182D28
MEPLDVDIDALRRGAEQLGAAKESVRQTFESFQAAVAGYEQAFGGDDIGMLLGVAHQACVEAVAECLGTNITELESYAESLRGMADGYQTVEDGVSEAFRSILGKLG